MPDMQGTVPEYETGVITRLQDGNAIVELNLQPACENCGARVVCVPDTAGKRALKVSNPLHAQVGSRVVIAESSDFLLKVSAIQYGIPFIGFLAGIFLFYFLKVTVPGVADELIYFCGGLAGLGLSALISRRIAQSLAESGRSFFTITKVIEK